MGPQYFDLGKALGSLLILFLFLSAVFSIGRSIARKLNLVKTPAPTEKKPPSLMGSRLWKLIGWVVIIAAAIFACYFLVFRVSPEERLRRAAEAATETAEAVRTEVQSAMELVCQGTPFSAAASYTGSRLHPAALVGEDPEGFGRWSNEIPESWFPATSAEAQLVVCVGKAQHISLEVCPYIGSDITRYRTDLPVRILEARTGKLVAQKTFVGSDPRHCQATEKMSTTVLYGESTNYIEVENWLRPYIESGAATFQPEAKEIDVLCGFWGDSPQYVEADQTVSLYWRWTATTEEYRQDYMDAVTIFLRLDDNPLDISTADRSLEYCEIENGSWPCVIWRLAPMTLDRGSHLVVFESTLNREITDGFDFDQNGSLDTYGPDTWESPACEIIIQ